MDLTVQIGRLPDGRWKATFNELPGVIYRGTKKAVEARAAELVHALRSPHLRVDRITPEGDVILTLSRAHGETPNQIRIEEGPWFSALAEARS